MFRNKFSLNRNWILFILLLKRKLAITWKKLFHLDILILLQAIISLTQLDFFGPSSPLEKEGKILTMTSSFSIFFLVLTIPSTSTISKPRRRWINLHHLADIVDATDFGRPTPPVLTLPPRLRRLICTATKNIDVTLCTPSFEISLPPPPTADNSRWLLDLAIAFNVVVENTSWRRDRLDLVEYDAIGSISSQLSQLWKLASSTRKLMSSTQPEPIRVAARTWAESTRLTQWPMPSGLSDSVWLSPVDLEAVLGPIRARFVPFLRQYPSRPYHCYWGLLWATFSYW